jgi:hypothetical protein
MVITICKSFIRQFSTVNGSIEDRVMELFSHREIEVYTVWVDGIQMSQEINNLRAAQDVYDDWKRLGYENVDLMCEYKFEE